MAATSFGDCVRFAQSVTSIGGALPKRIQGLLSGWEVLNAPAAAGRQDDPIVDACLTGTLSAEKLAELLPAAAAAAWANQYRAGLGRGIENTLTGEWHRQLKKDGADQILNSLRAKFDTAAKAIEAARGLINPESTAEHVIESGQPELVTAWQQLSGHIQTVARIGRVAAQFGSKPTAMFPQIVQYSLAEDFRVSDEALMCCDGTNLAIDSAPFMVPDRGHRTSPWFRVPLKLHSIESATARYNAWAAAEFDRVHSGPRGGRLIDGQVITDPVPPNPFREKTNA